jgi:hypothetical protein
MRVPLESNSMAVNSIEPYTNAEYCHARDRLLQLAELPQLLAQILPPEEIKVLLRQFAKTTTIAAFQSEVTAPLIQAILNKTAQELTVNGLDGLDPKGAYLFLSNHRDILCDPLFLAYVLHQQGFQTPQVCLGDNLLIHPVLIDFVKMNQGVTVHRHLPPRERLQKAHELSAYLHTQIQEKHQSVWLAQREGRAKDGKDLTQSSLVKMLTLEGRGSAAEERLAALQIIPVSISYEWDPCDALKAQERFETEQKGTYEKAPLEDLKSILTGLLGWKGRIHIEFGRIKAPDSNQTDPDLPPLQRRRQLIALWTESLDSVIQKNMRPYSSFYVAHDLLNLPQYAPHKPYTEEEKNHFLHRMETQLSALRSADSHLPNDPSHPRLRRLFLEPYANTLLGASKKTCYL